MENVTTDKEVYGIFKIVFYKMVTDREGNEYEKRTRTVHKTGFKFYIYEWALDTMEDSNYNYDGYSSYEIFLEKEI